MMHKWIKACGLVAGAMMLAGLVQTASAADNSTGRVTFYKDVLPILQQNCQECHRPNGVNMGGMVAPMSFMSYEETRPWAKSIARQVANKTMPPWHATEAFKGVFIGERYMSDEDINTIVTWVEQRVPRGDKADAPEPLVFSDSEDWSIGEPDLILSMPEPYFVSDDISDININFQYQLTAEDMPEDRWIKAAEFRPGSPVVHHIIARPFGGIAPGNAPTVFPDGFAAKVSVGQRVTWNMHYHKEDGPGTGMWDQSTVGVKFYPIGYEPKHVITTDSLGSFNVNIPPGAKDVSLTAKHYFDEDAKITNLLPHMHLRGVKALYTATYPDGTEEVLLDVPRYDYNWQTTYRFKEPKFVPKGTTVTFTGWWDNSSDNPLNPDPTKTLRWGDRSDDEMLFGWMGYIDPEPRPEASGGE